MNNFSMTLCGFKSFGTVRADLYLKDLPHGYSLQATLR